MTLYDTEQWHDLFVAGVGATATLAGLVFVAVSINIQRILKLPGAPERGLQTILLLLGSLIVCTAGLIPQHITSLGWELLAGSLVLIIWLGFTTRTIVRGLDGHRVWVAARISLTIPGSITYAIAGVSLVAGAGGGLAWVVIGLVGAMIGAVINAWVLLVEILR